VRILILHDEISGAARPDEADTIAQAKQVAAALARAGHTATLLSCPLDLSRVAADIRSCAPDLVFNLVESIDRQGRLIHLAPALLESMGAPFAGCGATAMFATCNKPLAKRLLAGAGLPTPPAFTLDALRDGAPAPPARYIIKSSWEHASVGLDEDSVVAARSAPDLIAAIERRLPHIGGEGFAEMFVDGREFNLSLLAGPAGPQVLPPAEIVFAGYAPDKPHVVGYRSKWDATSFEFSHTPRRFDFPPTDAPLLRELTRLSLACWSLFDLRGWARVDFRVDPAGRPFILEVNANPCLSPDAGFAAACARAGLGLDDAIARIVADAPAPRASRRAALTGSAP
jgi:D-alanine-D-alanine ligase